MAQPAPPNEITVINVPKSLVGDLYHLFLRTPWWQALLSLAGLFLTANLFFAVLYMLAGGIANARAGSFADAFFFSVQTLGTVGYGAMYPTSRAANFIVTAEAFCGLVVSAITTGVVFARFSMPVARLAFSREVTLFDMDGQRTLAFRVGNQRANTIVEAQVRVSAIRTEKTREGHHFYRMYDLQLVRDRSPALGRSWTVLHRVVEGSPLYGATPESLKRDEIELIVSILGIDGTTAQTVHGRHTYDGEKHVLFGKRHADMLTTMPDGRLVADYSRFHETVAAALTT